MTAAKVISFQEQHELRALLFGDFFIYKCLWSSPTSLRGFAVSLKKFYAFLQLKGEVSAAQLDEIKAVIKDELDDWVEECRRYNVW